MGRNNHLHSVIILSLLAILLEVVSGCTSQFEDDLTQYVNPFVGTGAFGHTFPGPCLPFGMVQLSPDNGARGEKGYFYDNTSILGFSHTHLSGTGINTTTKYANIMFMPTTGPLHTEPGSAEAPEQGYRSRYTHDAEEARPGYYRVNLQDYGINVELTATERVGMHRYTFTESESAHIIIDITRAPPRESEFVDTRIEVLSDNQVVGYTSVSDGEEKNPITWYFFAEFNKPFGAFGTFGRDTIQQNARSRQDSRDVGAYLAYSMEAGEELIVRTGISFTSIEGAKRNLRAEVTDWDFDRVREDARSIWNEQLEKVRVTGGTKLNRIKHYTALYHSSLFPRLFSDVDGAYYSHFEDQVLYADGHRYYVDFSLWDTYRAVHPLFNLIEPERQLEMIKTLLAMYDQGGRIPLHISYRNYYSSGMLGDHGSTVILDSYLKGLRDFDTEKAYAGMRKNALEPGPVQMSRKGLITYKALGYTAADRERESVSLTLENSFVDWSLAQMARDLGYAEDHELFMERAEYYKNVWDSTTGFMRPRLADGSWLPACKRGEEPEILKYGEDHQYYSCWDPWWIGWSPNRHYTESNAHQYLWYVPHDIQGLIGLIGGSEAFIKRLDNLFAMPSSNSGPMYVGVTGSIGQYVHGNEPSHHVAYLYDYAGAPWKTQEKVREIMEYKYGVDRNGLAGNDDMGQMSAWFVFSILGFYPVCPGQPTYQIGSPLFEKAVLNLGDYYDNAKFTVIAENVSGDNKYIQSAKLNGQPLEKPWITHEDIINGGRLEFEMGPDPKKSWGASPLAAPPSMTVK